MHNHTPDEITYFCKNLNISKETFAKFLELSGKATKNLLSLEEEFEWLEMIKKVSVQKYWRLSEKLDPTVLIMEYKEDYMVGDFNVKFSLANKPKQALSHFKFGDYIKAGIIIEDGQIIEVSNPEKIEIGPNIQLKFKTYSE